MKTPAENAKEICDAIGKRINAIRKEKKMTLDHLADKTGFAKSYLSQIENMKREPPISTLAKIAYVLNVDVIYLLSGEIRQEDQNFSLVKPSERKIFHRSFGNFGYIYESLNFKKADQAHGWLHYNNRLRVSTGASDARRTGTGLCPGGTA